MAQIHSHSQVQIVLNGHTFTALADDNPPYEITRSDDTATFKIGQTGKISAFDQASFAGTFTIRLFHDSPSTRWCIERAMERQRRLVDRVRQQSFRGTIEDGINNVNWSMQGGFIQNVPPFKVSDQTYTAVWMFERIIANVSGGDFRDRFDTPA